MYTVKRAAELTGIPAETLRKWESRYGVVVPARSEGGYRMYDDRALQRLASMKALVDAGASARTAAERVLSAMGDAGVEQTPVDARLGDSHALAEQARNLDPEALRQALDDGFALGELEDVVDGWLMPALAELGGAWRSGGVSVAGEHFVSASVHRRLALAYDEGAGRELPDAPLVVVGLAAGSRHELGVLAFAALLRRRGLRVAYLGGDLPTPEWMRVVADRQPAAVVLAIPSSEDVPAVREVVQAVARRHPGVLVRVGGGHQDRVAEATHLLGHELAPAAARLAADLVRAP
jgi:DNA-binding transcriptional MerR regulator